MHVFKRLTGALTLLALFILGLPVHAATSYSIEVTSAAAVSEPDYSLYVSVTGISTDTEDVYYTLNTLDVSKKVKMSRLPFTLRYLASPAATLTEGKNTFVVFIANRSTGQVLSAPGSSKIFTVTYTPAPEEEHVQAIPPGQGAEIVRDEPPAQQPRTLESVSIAEGSALNVRLGESVKLHATALYSDGTSADVTNDVAWSSSASTTASVATVTGLKGVVTGRAVGEATIKAVLDERQEDGSARITISVLPKETQEADAMVIENPPATDEETAMTSEEITAQIEAIDAMQAMEEPTDAMLDASLVEQRAELAAMLEEARMSEDAAMMEASKDEASKGVLWFIGGLASALALSGIIALFARKRKM